jgi:hypothetical protein
MKQHANCEEGKRWDSDFHEYELQWTPGECHIADETAICHNTLIHNCTGDRENLTNHS